MSLRISGTSTQIDYLFGTLCYAPKGFYCGCTPALCYPHSLGLSGADQAVLKEAHASLMTLALEAAKTDSDSANIRYTYSMHVGMSKCKPVALPHYSPGAVLF